MNRIGMLAACAAALALSACGREPQVAKPGAPRSTLPMPLAKFEGKIGKTYNS